MELLKFFKTAQPEELDSHFSERLRQLLISRDLSCGLLLAGFWNRVLVVWTWVVVGSVAPVEFLHGRNQRRMSASELWQNFVGKYFIEESRRFLSTLLSLATQGSTQARLAPKPKRVRRPSVRDLFNKDFNAGLAASKLSCAIDSGSYWEENRLAFANLGAEQRRSYELEAEKHPTAKQAREAHRAIGGQSGAASSGHVAPPSAIVPAALDMDLSLLAASSDQLQPDGGSVAVPQDLAHSRLPLSRSNLIHFLSDDHGRQRGLDGIYHKFGKDYSRVAVGHAAEPAVSDVSYPRLARSRAFSSYADVRAMRNRLAAAIQSNLVSHLGDRPSHKWSAHGLLFEFVTDSCDEGVQPLVQYGFFPSGNLPAGLVQFRLNVIQCQEVDADDVVCRGVLLEYARIPFVRTSCKIPCASGVNIGMFKHFSLHEWVDEVVPEHMNVADVTARKLVYREIGGDRFAAEGESEPPFVFQLTVEDPLAGLHPDPHGEGASDPESDWDSLVPKPPSFGRGRKMRAPRVCDGVAHAIAQAIGFEVSEEPSLAIGDLPDSDHADTSLSESSSEHASDSEHIDDSDSGMPAPVVVGPTAANCMTFLHVLESTDAVTHMLPDFVMTPAWDVKCVSTGRMLAKIRCINGSSLRIDCKAEGHVRCKAHADIKGDFIKLNVALMLWAIAGSCMSADQHLEGAASLMKRWRESH